LHAGTQAPTFPSSANSIWENLLAKREKIAAGYRRREAGLQISEGGSYCSGATAACGTEGVAAMTA
jgi:hypothetical protein